MAETETQQTFLNKKELDNINYEYVERDDTKCGFWHLEGNMQRIFNSKKFIFGFMAVVMLFYRSVDIYQGGTISTMERQYKLSSKNYGIILACVEITASLGGVTVPYLITSKGHFPRWIAVGLSVYLGSILCHGIPYLIYGPGKEALSNTLEFGSAYNTSSAHIDEKDELCVKNGTKSLQCETESEEYQYPGVSIFLIAASLLVGLAEAFTLPLNVTYMDNNVKKAKMPIILTLTTFFRQLAYVLGSVLAYAFLKIYVDPSLTPTIDNKDPRWIGAWWMGWFMFAGISMVFIPIVASFPKVLPQAAKRINEKIESNKQMGISHQKPENSSSNLFQTLKRLFINKMLLCNNMAAIFYEFGYIPYYKYQVKYIEVQYQFSTSAASLIKGSVTMVFSALGFVCAGIVISILKPKARYLAGWNITVSVLSVFGILAYCFIGCSPINNVEMIQNSNLPLTCNSGCDCENMKYSPVCGEDNINYISPCHAGCTEKYPFENGSMIFSNCSCITSSHQDGFIKNSHSSFEGSAKSGLCPVDCMGEFYIFLVILCFNKFLRGTEEMANFLLGMRCVEKRDKAVSLGLTNALVCLIANLPSQVLFGYIYDYTCLLWSHDCGNEGNCWVYDTVSLRYVLNITAACFVLIGTMFDVGTFHYSKDVNIFDENENADDEIELKQIENETKPLNS